MRAHTVILGAGATVATIPDGDKYGNKSSVMNGLIKKLNLDEILNGISLSTSSDNLEDIYSELYLRPDCKETIIKLEKALYDYFAALELPDYPTIYDYLVLSLTEKDAIATFNWDPLLIQAYVRCNKITNNLPHIFCLHGNVGVGYCAEHREFGSIDAVCPACRKPFPPTKLLYPVNHKNYTSDEYIKGCWDATEYIIENSYMLTIFGYSAPSSDIEAVRLLKKAWGDLDKRQLEEVSIIDIISENEITKKWEQFIYSHHYRYSNDFFHSYLGMFPRRSCETVFATVQLNVAPDCSKGFHKDMTWDDINNTLSDVLNEEIKTPKGKNYPLHYFRKEQFS